MGADSVQTATTSQRLLSINKEVSIEVGLGVNLAETFFNNGLGQIDRVINPGWNLDFRTDRYTYSPLRHEKLKLVGGLYSSGSLNSEVGFKSVSVVGGVSLQANRNVGRRGEVFAGLQGGLGVTRLDAGSFLGDASNQKFTEAGVSGGSRIGFGVRSFSEKVPLGLSVYVASTKFLCTVDNFSAVTSGAAMMSVQYNR